MRTLTVKTEIGAPAIGRFAPSPTGPLHFGSLLAAVGSYCLARQAGGRWLLRIEDLDTPRVQPGAADQQLRTLEAFGFEWDGAVVRQSQRREAYEAALQFLRRQGMLFDCTCSRKEILASAPHAGEEGPVYPGTCRAGVAAGTPPRAVRLRVSDAPITFDDAVFGTVQQSLAAAVGDFVLRRADGVFAYQLAVVVDDAEAGVNQVVRGADLLSSTPRQIFLQHGLRLPVPAYAHLPLALGPDGTKISKRHEGVALALGEESRSLWHALHFLGQMAPRGLMKAPAPELLRWSVAHFDVSCVPRHHRTIFDVGGRALTHPGQSGNPAGRISSLPCLE
jgi:glutamyl-Q tRNA(Asp) synthetase